MSTTKKDTKGHEENFSRITIILKSQNHKNLDSVTNDIINIAREKDIECSGAKYIPTKRLSITTRKSPCGSGTATFDRFEMKIHTRKLTLLCAPESVSELTDFKIKPGVKINIKIFDV